MSPLAAKIIWALGCVAWYVIRNPHERRARRTPVAQRRDRVRDKVLVAISFTGLGLVPLIYVLTGQPRFADYPFHPLQAWLGTPVLAAAMGLFSRTHRHLRFPSSVTLQMQGRPRRGPRV